MATLEIFIKYFVVSLDIRKLIEQLELVLAGCIATLILLGSKMSKKVPF
jgi:hypothetical protein